MKLDHPKRSSSSECVDKGEWCMEWEMAWEEWYVDWYECMGYAISGRRRLSVTSVFMARGVSVLALALVAVTCIFIVSFTYPGYRDTLGTFSKSLTADDGQIRTRRTNIFFLKTHKCASSTVQNILMRMGSKHGLTFVLPPTGNYLGNPQPFIPALIGPTLVTPDRKYNIFTHHTRYNVTAMREVMYQDAPFVTIMREPVSLFESLYSYYGMSGFYNMNLTQFLRKPLVEIETLPRNARKIGVNQMSWDLGLDQDLFRSEAAVEHLIHKVEAEFQLVMVAEFMEVSLVLLKDLMGWDLEDITFLTLNARVQGSKVNLTLWERHRLAEVRSRNSSPQLFHEQKSNTGTRKVNSADVLLYEHFNVKFRAKVKDFGDDRMRREVYTLLDKNSELYERCIKSVTLPVDPGKAYNNFKYVLNDNLGELDHVCSHITLAELVFTEQLRTRQAEKMRVLSKLEGFLAWDPPGAILS
uniref:Uncharacterized protein n=1 Tax=Timema tahoe TaxID=61484 RepID=A0A7R9IE69_9NEOP|nr:unnamed protein product [Timema tahoe]